MSAQKIVNKFRKFGLPVDGVAILRNDILAIGDRTIDVHSCNYGYIRTSGRKRYSKGQQITGCDFLNNVTEDLFLVLIIDEGKKLDAYINAARQILDADSDVTILEIDVNKEAIQRAESIPPSLNKIAKISFQYTYQEVGKCDEGVCEYVEDVHCDVEPCESKSFCERVQECLPEPVDTDCTLQVGSGCCDYSVEGIDVFANCVEFTINQDLVFNEPEGGFNFFSFQTVQPIFPNYVFLVNPESNPDLGLTPTVEELCDAIEASFDSLGGLYSYQRNGNSFKVCYTGIEAYSVSTIGLEGAYNVEFDPFSYSINSQVVILSNQEYFNLLISFEQNIPDNTFQVLINSTWTDVTDEIVEGTWQRTNVCDDVITEWRIIDSEENVINNGEVTAACDEATEVTDSVCNWLQEHQTAIEQLQNNPSGLTCETLAECEAFVEVKDKADTAVQPDDLATVATTGSYNDLTDQPAIPAAQIQSDWNQANNAAVDFIKNKPTIPTAVSQLTNDSNFITLAQARAGAYSKFFADFAATSVNTNTSNVVIGSVLIPANTVTGNAILEIESAFSRAVSGANPSHKLFINTSNSFTGAKQIAWISTGATSLWSKGERSFKCGTGSLSGFSFFNVAAIDDLGNINAPSSTAVDWTIDQYILTVVNNATGETTTHQYTTVKVLTI